MSNYYLTKILYFYSQSCCFFLKLLPVGVATVYHLTDLTFHIWFGIGFLHSMPFLTQFSPIYPGLGPAIKNALAPSSWGANWGVVSCPRTTRHADGRGQGSDHRLTFRSESQLIARTIELLIKVWGEKTMRRGITLKDTW